MVHRQNVTLIYEIMSSVHVKLDTEKRSLGGTGSGMTEVCVASMPQSSVVQKRQLKVNRGFHFGR